VAPRLRPATDDELSRLIADQMEPYVQDRITAGEHPDEARRKAEEQIGALFPGGRPAPGQLVFMIVDDGAVVGSLWIGPHTPEQRQAFWVWNIEIAEAHRGRGIGRGAMLLAEEVARDHGATDLGLNVFGPNRVARRLYESLGYETMAVHMRKPLDTRATSIS
jgi:ribosomal protein S18 acetylase RimI-like enzyme